MAKNRFNHSWLHDHINDPYVKMAQREGYRARAAYKLKEIDEQDKLIKPGQVIVDLGSTPGSWSQYARNKLAQGAKRDAEREGGIDGTIIALDILPMDPIADVTFIQGDFREDEVLAQLAEIVGERQVDLVISDMAPNLSGVASADAARIEHLCDLALEFAQNHLKPKVHCWSNVFTAAVIVRSSKSSSSSSKWWRRASRRPLATNRRRRLFSGGGSSTRTEKARNQFGENRRYSR
jgi:23S rRNA (uridine2552-2'-O)-methyltransferase